MKLSISMSNYIAKVATNVFPIGNDTVRAFVVCKLAGTFSASLLLTNDHMVPVYNIVDTANPWILIGKYKRPHCILTLLNSG